MKILAALIVVGVLGLMTAFLRAWPWMNVVETGRTPQYPDLLPRTYPHAPEQVFDAAVHTVAGLSRWTLVATRPEVGEIHAEARTRMLRFVDDVRIDIRAGEAAAREKGDAAQVGMRRAPVPEHGAERTVVRIRSASRVGSADFGQNARNVREFFAALDRRLAVADRS